MDARRGRQIDALKLQANRGIKPPTDPLEYPNQPASVERPTGQGHPDLLFWSHQYKPLVQPAIRRCCAPNRSPQDLPFGLRDLLRPRITHTAFPAAITGELGILRNRPHDFLKPAPHSTRAGINAVIRLQRVTDRRNAPQCGITLERFDQPLPHRLSGLGRNGSALSGASAASTHRDCLPAPFAKRLEGRTHRRRTETGLPCRVGHGTTIETHFYGLTTAPIQLFRR